MKACDPPSCAYPRGPKDSVPAARSQALRAEGAAPERAIVGGCLAAVNSLGTIFKFSRSPDPAKDPEVVLAIKRRHHKIGRHQKQARPLTRNHLERILSNCSNELRGMPNRVLLQLGYETMRRRSELCAFKFEDLEITYGLKPALRLRRSKTDQASFGRRIPISDKLSNLIESWRERSDIKSGFILRAIDKHDNVKSKISPESN